jgi:hypothetical protein
VTSSAIAGHARSEQRPASDKFEFEFKFKNGLGRLFVGTIGHALHVSSLNSNSNLN